MVLSDQIVEGSGARTGGTLSILHAAQTPSLPAAPRPVANSLVLPGAPPPSSCRIWRLKYGEVVPRTHLQSGGRTWPPPGILNQAAFRMSERRWACQANCSRESEAVCQSDKRKCRIEKGGEQAREQTHGNNSPWRLYDPPKWRQYGDNSASRAY